MKLIVNTLIVFIISLNRAIQRELDSFFQKINSANYTIREVSKSAFSQELNEWGFIRLNEIAVDTFYSCSSYNVWNGHRLLAVDETHLMLPNHKTVNVLCGIRFNAL